MTLNHNGLLMHKYNSDHSGTRYAPFVLTSTYWILGSMLHRMCRRKCTCCWPYFVEPYHFGFFSGNSALCAHPIHRNSMLSISVYIFQNMSCCKYQNMAELTWSSLSSSTDMILMFMNSFLGLTIPGDQIYCQITMVEPMRSFRISRYGTTLRPYLKTSGPSPFLLLSLDLLDHILLVLKLLYICAKAWFCEMSISSYSVVITRLNVLWNIRGYKSMYPIPYYINKF